MAISLQSQVPKIKSAITGRLAMYIAGLASLVVISIIFAFYFKMQAQAKRTEVQVEQQVASDAATATPEQTSIATLRTPTTTPVSNPVIGAVGKPLVDARTLHSPDETPSPMAYTPVQYVPPATPIKTAAEIRLETAAALAEHQAQLQLQAIEAPTAIKQTSAAQAPATPAPAYSDPAQISALLHQPTMNPASMPAMEGTRRAGNEDNKEAFLSQPGTPQTNYLSAVRALSVSQFEIWQGARIPATLDVKLDSQNPGEITATVNEDVFDSATGKYCLIPAGSKIIGEYNSHTAYAQNRIQVAWTVMMFPDGSYLNLGRMNGQDGEGTSGLKDQTDNHWKRIIGGAVLTSVLSAGFQISQNRGSNSSVLQYPTTTQVLAGSIGQQAQQLGQEITQKNLSIPPTAKIRSGALVEIFVSRRIVFEGPYKTFRE